MPALKIDLEISAYQLRLYLQIWRWTCVIGMSRRPPELKSGGAGGGAN